MPIAGRRAKRRRRLRSAGAHVQVGRRSGHRRCHGPARDGDPVTTLRREDFTLLVDGSPRPLVSARLVESPAAPPSATAAPPAPTSRPCARRGRAPPVRAGRRPRPHPRRRRPADAACGLDVHQQPAAGRRRGALDAARIGHRSQVRRRPRGDHTAAAPGGRHLPGPVHGPWIVGRDEAIQAEALGRKEVLQSIIARECYKQPPNCPNEVQAQVIQAAADARARADATLAELGLLIDALGKLEGPEAPGARHRRAGDRHRQHAT